ncbi:MAG: hypothetical protein ACKO96_32825 [Flammeovirgaceae bacterium]
MNSTIKKVVDKLTKYPDVKYNHTDSELTIEPTDKKGFAVTIGANHREIVVSADFWHEHFDNSDEEKALNCFAFLLSDSCRLKIEYKGEKPKTWTLESFENGQWIGDSTTGLFNPKFWQPTRVEYLQNGLIKTSEN